MKRLVLAATAIAYGVSVDAFLPAGRSHALRPSKIDLPNLPKASGSITQLSAKKLAATHNPFKTYLSSIWTNSVQPFLTASLGPVLQAFKDLSKFQKILFLATFVVGFSLGRCRPFWRSFRNTRDVPSRFFGAKAPLLHGKAVTVGDGDTIRFFHRPLFWTKVPKKMKVSEMALPIRLCTIDTPETPKFGKPGQPYGKEAKEELKSLLGNKTISIRLLRLDQYGRAVAQLLVPTRFFFRKRHVDEYMLQKGLAEVYLGGGAVYGPRGMEDYLQLEATARKQKLGIWSLDNRESAAEYKKRTK